MRKQIITISVIMAVIVMAACGDERKGPIRKHFGEIEDHLEELDSRKPELSQSMNQIQIHHMKLYYAFENDNKSLMQYLVHELEEGFEYIVENHAKHEGVNLAALAESTVLPALETLDAGLTGGDSARVLKDIEYLTVTCNKCHIASGHDFIRIKRPGGNVFPDQDFSME